MQSRNPFSSACVRFLASCLFLILHPSIGRAQTTLAGNGFALRSSGVASGTDWTLNNNGYIGTYLALEAAGTVRLTVTAAGASTDATMPRMGIVVGDFRANWDVTAGGFREYSTSASLPAGTHFVRIEFNNDVPTADRSLTIRNLDLNGATLANANSNENALRAARTYIENFRRGPVRVRLPLFAPGTQVKVELQNHAFNFGAIASGFTSFADLADNPPQGSQAYNYQQLIAANFNALVPSNGGKWTYNENLQDQITMEAIDSFLTFAERRGFRARMHNLIWDTNQQPLWVQNLIAQAVAGDANAKETLRKQIIERIDYYVRNRAKRYVELDVFNESLHQRRYWQIFGAAGTADIFNEVDRALKDAGSNALTMLNEFNVVQFSTDPVAGGSDPYANWYRAHIDEIRNAGGKMSAIGIQYYGDVRTSAVLGSATHSAARIQQVYQNLSVTGLPISLTEFSVLPNGGTWDWNYAAQIMDESVRMTFGTPGATGFMFWGLRSTAANQFGLVDADWKLTPPGERYQQMMSEWDVNLTTAIQDDGAIQFNGFYGDYILTVNGQQYALTLVKGQREYLVGGYPMPSRISRPRGAYPVR